MQPHLILHPPSALPISEATIPGSQAPGVLSPSATDRRIASLSRLLDVALKLATEHDLTRILEIVANGVCRAVDCERASLFLITNGGDELYTRVVTELEIREIRLRTDHGVSGWVARHRHLAHVADPHGDPRWDSSIDARTGYVTRNILAAPVISTVDDRLVGVLQLLNKSEGDFDEFDQQLIQAFASHAATAVERRRLQEEALRAHELKQAMEMGRRIQRGFLPAELPSIPGYEVASWWQPAEFVSGDYYDWLPLPDGRLAFAIGDVSGHGLGPSLIMASLRAMLHVLAKTSSDPKRIVELLAESIAPDLKQSQFISFLLVALDPLTHEIQFANAGHAPALRYESLTNSFRQLEATRLPLGFPQMEVGQHKPPFQLGANDLLVLGTDGVVEARNPAGTMFGVERLQQLLSSHRDLSARDIVAVVSSSLQQFHGLALPPDDSTLVIVKRIA